MTAMHEPKRILAVVTAATYIACVALANVLTEHLGLVPVGFGLLVTAGTFAAGGTLLARNVLQTLTGWSWRGRLVVVGLMLAGVGLSWWLASPALAEASGVAFALSESTDLAVFTWQRRRGWSRAVAAAGVAAGLVDTLAFLYLAGFPVTTDSVAGQFLVKAGISWLVAASVALISRFRAVPKDSPGTHEDVREPLGPQPVRDSIPWGSHWMDDVAGRGDQ